MNDLLNNCNFSKATEFAPLGILKYLYRNFTGKFNRNEIVEII